MREAIADWLMVLGAPILLLSLFLTWSHQFSRGFLVRYEHTTALAGIPHDPTAWQVYSIIDVLLALLAVGLFVVALQGSRPGRIGVLMALGVAIVFVIHALGSPPTNGANLFDPALGAYTPNHPTSGAGEIVALIGLLLGGSGVALSFTV